MTRTPDASIWKDDAACHDGWNPEIWFPVSRRNSDLALALRICAGCPVRTACLAEGRRVPGTVGIWGGVDLTRRSKVAA